MARTTTRIPQVTNGNEIAADNNSGDHLNRLIKTQKKAVGKPKEKKVAERPKAASNECGIKKQYLKSACKVTFMLPESLATDAKTVCIAGDFNGWDVHAHPMQKTKTGHYAATLVLDPGKEYQFKYVIDGERWANAPCADSYVPSPYCDSENAVIIV